MHDAALAEVVRRLADAVLIADADGQIVFWNAAAERLFGRATKRRSVSASTSSSPSVFATVTGRVGIG